MRRHLLEVAVLLAIIAAWYNSPTTSDSVTQTPEGTPPPALIEATWDPGMAEGTPWVLVIAPDGRWEEQHHEGGQLSQQALRPLWQTIQEQRFFELRARYGGPSDQGSDLDLVKLRVTIVWS